MVTHNSIHSIYKYFLSIIIFFCTFALSYANVIADGFPSQTSPLRVSTTVDYCIMDYVTGETVYDSRVPSSDDVSLPSGHSYLAIFYEKGTDNCLASCDLDIDSQGHALPSAYKTVNRMINDGSTVFPRLSLETNYLRSDGYNLTLFMHADPPDGYNNIYYDFSQGIVLGAVYGTQGGGGAIYVRAKTLGTDETDEFKIVLRHANATDDSHSEEQYLYSNEAATFEVTSSDTPSDECTYIIQEYWKSPSGNWILVEEGVEGCPYKTDANTLTVQLYGEGDYISTYAEFVNYYQG